MITKAPQPATVTLYEALRAANMDECDISDFDWDWGNCIVLPEAKSIEECEDAYEKFILLVALNLKTKAIERWYTPCDVCGFIEENRAAFERFFNEENREGYRPKDYEGPLKPDEDEGYFEAFMLPLGSLLNGDYCEDNYEKLVNMLLA